MKKLLIFGLLFFALLVNPVFADSITVTTNVTDTVAPVINSYSFSASDVGITDPINLTINASDNSEISMVWATFRYPNSSIVNHTAYLSSGTNQSGIFTIRFNDTGATGYYTATYVFVNDSNSSLTYNLSAITFSAIVVTSTSSASPGFGGAGTGEPSVEVEETPEEPEVTSVPSVPSEECIENWVCSDWSDCTDSMRTRVCADRNSCGTTENKPIESEACTPTAPPEEQVPLGVPLGVWSLGSLMVAGLVVYIFVRKRNMQKERRRHLKKVK